MTGLAGRRVWGLLAAALAAVLLLVAPAGHAQAGGTQSKAAVQALIAHDAVVVAPTTRAAAGRRTHLDAAVTRTDSPAAPQAAYQTAPRPLPAAQEGPDTASARAPPLKV